MSGPRWQPQPMRELLGNRSSVAEGVAAAKMRGRRASLRTVPDTLDAATARRWAAVARAVFARRRAGIDALNVFPVPDGDTGTNMYLSLESALEAVTAERERRGIVHPTSLGTEAATLADAMLLSARGNSGVILSQFMRGLAEAYSALSTEHASGADVAGAMARAAERARSSVTHPVEGTILTVADAAAAAAQAAAAGGGDLHRVTVAAVGAAGKALAATTEQLPVLARAGVVDAGGAGLLLLLECLDRVVRAEPLGGSFDVDAFLKKPALVGPGPGGTEGGEGLDLLGLDGEGGTLPAGPAYEVMFLLRETDYARVDELRRTLDTLGDSLLVVGGPELWNVHVHVDDAGAAIEAGVAAGLPYRIRITHLADLVARRRAQPADTAIVACAAGPGLASLIESQGAHPVLSGPGRRASAGQILAAIRAVHALSVIVLPNDVDTVMAAQAAATAAEQEGIEVHVVTARTAVQGLAALAVFEPTASLGANVQEMTAAAAATRQGAVTVAITEALTSGGWCQPGDVLGVVQGDIVIVGSDLLDVASEVVRRLLSSGGELLTVVTGADAPAGLAHQLEEVLRHERRDVDVHVVYGGQPHYPLLLGVE
jgi:DAK2 domain fusion protein YloV